MDKRIMWSLPVLGLLVWYLWTNQGKAHKVTVDPRAVDPPYAPYRSWITMRPGGYVHQFPDRVGPACLDSPIQNGDDGALSVFTASYEPEGYASA